MFDKILDFIESKVEGFDRPKLCETEINIFEYNKNIKTIHVPIDLECDEVIELQDWWSMFMRRYLINYLNIMMCENDYIIFAFLHEIGHHVTLKEYNYKEFRDKYYKELGEKCLLYGNLVGYRKISFEQMADEWAVNFINNYPEVVSMVDVTIN